jgi:hypothetical protein
MEETVTPRTTPVILGLVALAALAGGGPAFAQPVTVQYTATVVTVSGTPFGFNSSIRLAPISGFFTYNRGNVDTLPADTARGNYPHTPAFPGAFSAILQGTTFTGSATPFAQVENFAGADTFRFEDGPSNNAGIMSVNGTPNAVAALFMALTDGSGNAFANDSLPALFPFARPPLANPAPTFPHTFSLSDSGGTLLMQFNTLNAVPEPSALALALVAPGVVAARRWRRRNAQS